MGFLVPPQPAKRNLFFELAHLNNKILRWCVKIYWEVVLEELKTKNWVTVPVAFVAIFIPGSLMMGLLFGSLAVVFATTCAALLVLILVLRVTTLLYQGLHKIFYSCPHCYHRIAYPHHLCPDPDCGAKHTHLFPSHYGIFYRTCECGRQLPTLGFLGLRKFDKYCPRCNGLLPSGAGAQPDRHFALIGGPASGKSNFLLQTTDLLLRAGTLGKGRARIADEQEAQKFELNMERLRRGVPASKTRDEKPTAFTLNVDWAKKSSLIYFYDAAGEVFTDADKIMGHQIFLRHVSAMFFILDPFSLPELAQRHKQQIVRVSRFLRPGSLMPSEAMERTLDALNRFLKVRKPGEKFDFPLAVLLAKWDAIQQIVQPGAFLGSAEEVDAACRQFLHDWGESNLAGLIAGNFKHHRFFPMSALGRMPDEPGHDENVFEEDGVGPPLRWVLQQLKITR